MMITERCFLAHWQRDVLDFWENENSLDCKDLSVYATKAIDKGPDHSRQRTEPLEWEFQRERPVSSATPRTTFDCHVDARMNGDRGKENSDWFSDRNPLSVDRNASDERVEFVVPVEVSTD